MTRTRYRITVRGRLSDRFASAFQEMTLEPQIGETDLVGALDQSELQGVLLRIHDFGLELVRVEERAG